MRAQFEARSLAHFAAGLVLVATTPAYAQSPVFDAKGFSPNRELIQQLPFEHVDPLTGNLLLTFIDLELPGNAGFGLRVQRTYNSKIYNSYQSLGANTIAEDSWVGIGWTLHFGRVARPDGGSGPPIVEMPDGSRHPVFPHLDGVDTHFMTREHWTYEKIGTQLGVLRLPNGVTYRFDSLRGSYLYVTEITDPFGNRIVVKYPPVPSLTDHDVIDSVELRLLSGEVRKVKFTIDELLPYPAKEPRRARSLATMSYEPPTTEPVRVWTYDQKLREPYDETTLLLSVTPPQGPPWQFEYHPAGLLTPTNHAPLALAALTTPQGGRIAYAYQAQLFYYGGHVVYTPALKARTVSGPGLEPGTWTYAFESMNWDLPITATVTSPCNRTVYVTNPIGPLGDERAWAIGTQARKEVRTRGDDILEVEDLEYERSALVSLYVDVGESAPVYAPLLHRRKITRGGKTYETTFTYDPSSYSHSRPNNFNDHGRAKEVVEDGESGALTRKTTRSFFYGSSTDPSFGSYIVDKVASETVRVPAGGAESFTNTYAYETAGGYRGFLKSQTIRGITTTFLSNTYGGKPTGNVGSATDANGHVTSYAYTWGRAREIKTPAHTTTRVINSDGSVASETRRGFTTSFRYDLLGRPTRQTPPIGKETLTTYDDVYGRQATTTRGPSTVTTTFDGLGRAVSTVNNAPDPVKTTLIFDVCGRRTFASYPYTSIPKPLPGSTYTYDALGRTTLKTDPGDDTGHTTTVQIGYPSGADVDIVDENGHVTKQRWAAFGDPEDRRLLNVRDATNEVTSYTYNTLGALRSVTLPGGPGRTWAYYGPGEAGGTPGLLKSESQPENGTVTFTYDAVGNLDTRTDAAFGATVHTYDGNNRLVFVDRPGTAYDTTIGYDESDNRTLLQNAYARSTFSFDKANRLTERKDELSIRPAHPQTLTTSYAYDDNDRLATITYPSHTTAVPRKVQYTYDAAGRILSVFKPGSPIYASNFSYHPSGAPISFKTGDGRSRTFGYTPRYRLNRIDSSVLRLQYAYEPNGNVSGIDDLRAGFDQTFGYDQLDRLTRVSGFSAGNYGYDKLGNRLSGSVGGASSFTYDDATLRLTAGTMAGAPHAWSYDANGNTREHKVSGTTTDAYTFTPEDMVETASVEGAVTTYRYDGDNQRVSKEQGGSYRYFTRGPGGILSELTDSCTVGAESVRDYVYAGERLVAIVEPSPPTVALIAAAATVAETPGAFVAVAVKLTTATGSPTSGEVSVPYATADGPAHAGSDYVATAGTLVFPACSPSGTVQVVGVPLINDTLPEPTEAFSFRLSNPSGGILGPVSSEAVTIADNDTPVVSWVAAAASVLESGGAVSLTARLTTAEGNALNAAASVGYATTSQTAVAPADYTAVSGTLTFAAGTASGAEQSVTIPIVLDNLVEPNETLRLVLASPVGLVVGAPAAVTVTVVDVSPMASVGAGSLAVLETPGPVLLPVRLTTPDGLPTAVPATFAYATSNLTAKSPDDYASAAGSLTFPAGSPSGVEQVVAVPLVADLLVEPDETFRFTLSKPIGGKLGTPSVTTVTIVDSSPTVSFTAAAVAVSEGAGSVGLTIRLTTPNLAATNAPVTVKFATANLTARAPGDYAMVSGTLTFPAGAPSGSEQVVSVPVVRDALVEPNETFRLVLSAPLGARLGAIPAATITLLDVSPSVAFVGPSTKTGEGVGPAAVAVRLTTPDELPTTAPVTVKFTTSNLTALAGADYAATIGTLTFPAGTATGATVNASVLLKDDILSEDDETFKLTLSAPVAARLGTQATTTVKILDDDPLPGVSIADATVTEPNGGLVNMTFKLALSAPAGRVVSVAYATSDGSAVAPSDYQAKSGIVSFPAGKTSAILTVSVAGDTVDEENEAFLVNLGSPVKVVLGRATAQGVILDNDGLTSSCLPIVTVPYEITTSGRYCLGRDVAFEPTEGAAIAVNADFVSLDLRGFTLEGIAGSLTQARGIHAEGRRGVSVSNGRVTGFLYGVQLEDTYPYASGGHRVERVAAEGNTLAGVYVAGQNSVVRQCAVVGTGGLAVAEGEAGTDTLGIAAVGPGSQLLDNDVSDTRGNGSGRGRALFVLHGQGTVVQRNRLVGDSGATGLLVVESNDVVAVRNRFTGFAEGIVFDGASSGAYRGNLTSGVAAPYSGGSDAGDNE